MSFESLRAALETVADRIANGDTWGNVRDVNGNGVGAFELHLSERSKRIPDLGNLRVVGTEYLSK